MGYLDNQGLSYFWNKIKDYVNSKLSGVPVKPVTQEQYDALSEEEKNGDVVYLLTDADPSAPGGENTGEVYSTEETRIGTWIDGKPLYRKTYSIVTNATGVSNVRFDIQVNILNIYGIVKYSGNSTFYSLPAFIPENRDHYCILSDNGWGTGITARYTGNFVWDMPLIFTIEYTKTADQATNQLDAQPLHFNNEEVTE